MREQGQDPDLNWPKGYRASCPLCKLGGKLAGRGPFAAEEQAGHQSASGDEHLGCASLVLPRFSLSLSLIIILVELFNYFISTHEFCFQFPSL